MTTVLQAEEAKGDRYLIFRISKDLYGLEVRYLKEVFQSGNILKLPRTSAVLEGIVNLRGYIVSIFNLSILLWGIDHLKKEEISPKIDSKRNVILLLTIKDQDVGVLVDQIHRLDTITDFVAKDDTHFQGRELLNPSLISQIGFLDGKEKIFVLDLEGLLGGFLTAKRLSKKDTKIGDGGDFDFDFDQYTLPDTDAASTALESDLEMNQLNLPESQVTDEFDQAVFDEVDVERKGKKLKKAKTVDKKFKKSKKSKKDLKETTKTKKPKTVDKAKKDLKEVDKSKKAKTVDEAKKDLKEVDKSKKAKTVDEAKKDLKEVDNSKKAKTVDEAKKDLKEVDKSKKAKTVDEAKKDLKEVD
ncbi:MAG: chemotaxis protein CheW, partial [Candidatus Hodarchaeales archaeon]